MTQQARKLAAPENFVGGVNVTKAVAELSRRLSDSQRCLSLRDRPSPLNNGSPLADNEMEPTIESRMLIAQASS